VQSVYITNGVYPRLPDNVVRELEITAMDYGVTVQEVAALVLVDWERRRAERRVQEEARR